jgi:hypothetical protein
MFATRIPSSNLGHNINEELNMVKRGKFMLLLRILWV